MTIRNFISEDNIEKAAIEVFQYPDINYRHLDCQYTDLTGRTSETEVVIKPLLWQKLKELNPSVSDAVLQQALDQLTSINKLATPFQANRDAMRLITLGVKVDITQPDGSSEPYYVKIIDWDNYQNNDFLVVSQLWLQGEVYRIRPDLIVFVNGLPLVLIELKNSTINVQQGYNDNIVRYKKSVPDLFVYNAFLIVSNGIKTRVGSTFASWEFFFPWLRVDDEKQAVDKERIEAYGRSLDYAIRGLLKPKNLIDYIDNFIFFYNDIAKICAKNHQFIGVNKGIDRFAHLRQNIEQGIVNDENNKLGVFWHTQGSGKSFSMAFLARKIMRRFVGNYTFLIVTDRDDLDEQIYKNFLRSGIISPKDNCRPAKGSALRTMLTTNTKCIFTLIQKFRYDKGKEYPLLSERNDIIVFIDEAHRTQYKSLADNMRAGLPNAQFMAFTGTPLFGSKQLTNKWFGKNVSEYNFQQAVEDEATVPIFYRKRLPQIQQVNSTLTEDFLEIIENEELSDQERIRLEQEYGNELTVIRNPNRLEEIAKDIAYHFPRRGYLGKGMVVGIDKFTAVRLYDFVAKYWKEELNNINKEIAKATGEAKEELLRIRKWMRETEMAVVVSEEAGEEEKFTKEGLDIRSHRQKMNAVEDEGQDIEDRFKDPNSNFRLVFVCSKWLTGFDVPTASVLYLDKPMKDHTLMQTIARVNRVTDFEIDGKTKKNGLIIDYCNVFGRLKKAMSTYGGGSDDESIIEDESESPVKEGAVLFDLLQKSIDECVVWCSRYNIDLKAIQSDAKIFNQIDSFYTYADIIIGLQNGREQFKVYDNAISALYDACRPEILTRKQEFILAEIIHYLRNIVENSKDTTNIDNARFRFRRLLDESIVSEEIVSKNNIVSETSASYGIKSYKEIDLSKLNIDKLREEFKTSKYKNIEIDDLRSFLESKLSKMLQENNSRTDFATKLQNIIDKYNAGSYENEEFFEELLKFQESLSQEAQRATREGLTEAELEIFDLLKKENLNKDEKQKVKLAAKELLTKLRENQNTLLIPDWYKNSQYQNSVKDLIGTTLNNYLPESYDRNIFSMKKSEVYHCILAKSVQGVNFMYL